jgi:hypothetical protein
MRGYWSAVVDAPGSPHMGAGVSVPGKFNMALVTGPARPTSNFLLNDDYSTGVVTSL